MGPNDPTEREALEAFLEWFDSHFPKDGETTPPFSLWQVAQTARKALGSGNDAVPDGGRVDG